MAAAVIAYSEVVTGEVVLFHAFDLMDAACGITRRVAHGAAQLERNIEIARDALAVGIDHRKDCLASECTLCAAVHLSISAFARFHGIGGLSESVIRVQ